MKGACVSGVDSWPGLCGRDCGVPCRAAALGVGGTAAFRAEWPRLVWVGLRRSVQSGRAWCGRDCGALCRVAALGVGGTAALRAEWPRLVWEGWRGLGKVVPVWCGRDALGSSRFLWGMRGAFGSFCFLWGIYEYRSGLFSWQMRVRGWVLLWEKGLHRRWVVVGLYGFPPPPSRGQALRGNDEWASGGVGVT